MYYVGVTRGRVVGRGVEGKTEQEEIEVGSEKASGWQRCKRCRRVCVRNMLRAWSLGGGEGRISEMLWLVFELYGSCR